MQGNFQTRTVPKKIYFRSCIERHEILRDIELLMANVDQIIKADLSTV